MSTLKELLIKKSNDYSYLENLFNEKSKIELLSDKNYKLTLFKNGISIIIPSYNSNKTLSFTLKSIIKNIVNIPKNLIELIIVDDGSKYSLDKIIKPYLSLCNIKLIKNYNNLGSAESRWEGVKIATKENILFLDSDIVITNNFILNHLCVHNILPNKILLVSFLESITIEDKRLNIENLENSLIDFKNKDFRFATVIRDKYNTPIKEIGKSYHLIEQSDYFKNFGNFKKIGLWRLSMMGLIGCMSVSRKILLESQNNYNKFKGWGWDDTLVTSYLLAYGLYLVPNLNSPVLQIKHPFRSGNIEDKKKQFLENKIIYNNLLNKEYSSNKIKNLF